MAPFGVIFFSFLLRIYLTLAPTFCTIFIQDEGGTGVIKTNKQTKQERQK